VSRLDLTLDPKAARRRVEVITGGGGGRHWSDDEKARAIEESLVPGTVVSAVARRHGLTPQQLFTWRREARRKAAESTEPPFVPAVVDTTTTPAFAPGRAKTRDGETSPVPVVEVEIGDAHVWIWSGADIGVTTAVLCALQRKPNAK
jgi:transposase